MPSIINFGKKSGGDIPVTIYDNLTFNNANPGTLPYTLNADYEIFVDFTVPTYYKNMPIIGNSLNANTVHLTEFSNKYYTGNGSGEANFTATLTGRHIFINNHNNKNLFDGVEVTDYTPTTNSSVSLTVGSRGDLVRWSYYLRGSIHEYKITSISTGNIIADYKPAKVYDFTGLYDRINNSFVGCGSSVSNNS